MSIIFTTTDRVLLPIRVDPKLPIFVNMQMHCCKHIIRFSTLPYRGKPATCFLSAYDAPRTRNIFYASTASIDRLRSSAL